MQETNPLVTVYMPTHNRRTFLERALKSVVDQTYKNVEIIVVDDGSTDDTEKFMQEFLLEYPNIKYLKHDISKGANAARNYAIRESHGYFVTGIDDDDEMRPSRIEQLVKAYDDKYAYVSSINNQIHDDGKRTSWGSKKKIITLDSMLYGNETGNQVLSTREMFYKAGLFDEDLVAEQDYDMWIRMLKIKPIAKVVDAPLYNMYIHMHERITTSNKRYKGRIQCYLKHKSIMNLKQRKARILRIRYRDKGNNARNIKYRYLYNFIDWPRLYIAHYKHKLF